MPDLPLTHRSSAYTAPKHISAEQQAIMYDRQPTAYARQEKRFLHTGDRTWRKIRAEQLRKEPLCRMCKAEGHITAASHVDHINGDASTLESNNPNNLQSLCVSCHMKKTATEGASVAYQYLPKFLHKIYAHLFVVCGPPCSGKTTYVKENSKHGDLILDLDTLSIELYDRPMYELSHSEYSLLIRERNNRLIPLSNPAAHSKTCWLITTAGNHTQRQFWQTLGGEVIVMQASKDTCMRRLVKDSRPDKIKPSLEKAIIKWH